MFAHDFGWALGCVHTVLDCTVQYCTSLSLSANNFWLLHLLARSPRIVIVHHRGPAADSRAYQGLIAALYSSHNTTHVVLIYSNDTPDHICTPGTQPLTLAR